MTQRACEKEEPIMADQVLLKNINGVLAEERNYQDIVKAIVQTDGVKIEVINNLETGEFHREFANVGPKKIVADENVASYKSFNDQIIIWEFATNKLASLFRNGAFVNFDAVPVSVVFPVSKNLFLDNKLNPVDDFDPEEYLYYKGVVYNNSQEKKKSITSVQASDKAEVTRKLDKLTFGAFTEMCGTKLAQAVAVKKINRLGQTMAPSIDFDRFLKVKYVLAFDFSDTSSRDGQDVVLADLLAEALSAKDTIGMLVQARPTNISKGAFFSVSKAVMNERLKDAIYLAKEDLTDEVIEQINLAFNKNDGKFKNKTIVFGTKMDKVGFITNRDIHKAASDWTQLYDGYCKPVMAFAKQSATPTMTLSMQMALNLLLGTDKGFDFLSERLEDNVREKFLNLVAKENRVIGYEEVQKDNIYAQGVIEALAYEYIRDYDRAMFRSQVRSVNKGVNNQIAKGRVVLAGTFAQGLLDPGVMFGYEILHAGEVYQKEANAYLARAAKAGGTFTKHVAVNRSPKPGFEDEGHYEVLAPKEINARIDEVVKDETHNALIKELYASVSHGIIVLPYDPCLNLLHSGSDWDFDGFSVIFDQEYVAIAKQVRKNFREISLKDNASKRTTFADLIKK